MSNSSSFTLIRDANYRIFWAGQGVSWLGSVMQSVAQGWLVWSLTRSPAQLALTSVMLSLPVLLFSMLGGVTADRFDKRALLVITQGGSIVPSIFLALLTVRGEITAPAILFLAFFQGVLNAFEAPARQALLAELLPAESLNRAVAFNALSFNATRLAGPVAAGCIIAAYGAAPCFFINSFSFLAGVLSLLWVRLPHHRADHPMRRRTVAAAELREGVRFVWGQGEVRRILISVLLVSLLAIPFVPLLPVFADRFQAGPRGLGVMSACLGSGSFLAALWLAFAADLPEQRGRGAGAGMLFALALLAFSRSDDYGLSLAALFVAGGAVAVFLANVNRSLQYACPDRLRGRVMGVYTLALLGMAPIGSTLVGGVAARLGVPLALSLTSALCIAALGLLQLPLLRRLFSLTAAIPLSVYSGTPIGSGSGETGKLLNQRSL